MKEVIKETFQFTDEKLPSGAIVTKAKVTIEEKTVTSIQEGAIVVNDSHFTFSLHGGDAGLYCNIMGVPMSLDGQSYVKEFIDFIESL